MVKDMDAKLERFIDKCKSMGLKITPQRVAVYEVLLNREDHPTVEEVYNEVKKRYPFVSLATVYRTVETLEELGFVKRVAYWGGSVRYDANTEDHHHLICTRCGAIKDIQLNINWYPPKHIEGYRVEKYALHIYGVCPECQKRES
ncbi:MAG: transcriptional repressor [Hydrogenobacter thermophilus]|uniref:Fur family transcriptional regulator n=1 Tax=Hydrogenobacter thermophilus TaxID=940 RepID=UPI001C78611F|nr:Fur family transcriptional regulator [Hydrogenobacter thermophilus]QWK18964.1 MAG: transcriptional repressor [Hydrogenobacter thermophilus]